MITRLRIANGSSPRVAQGVFTALTPVEGIVHVEFAGAWVHVEHDGRATVERLRAAVAVAGHDVEEVLEERRSLPTL